MHEIGALVIKFDSQPLVLYRARGFLLCNDSHQDDHLIATTLYLEIKSPVGILGQVYRRDWAIQDRRNQIRHIPLFSYGVYRLAQATSHPLRPKEHGLMILSS